MKKCTRCKEVKQYEDFGNLTAAPDGHRPACKACSKANRLPYNKELGRVTDKKRYAKESVRRKAHAMQYRADNSTRCAANDAKKHALRRGAVLPDNFVLADTLPFYEEARRLTIETGIPHEVDHIVSCKRGGLHCHTNLQVLTAAENNAKH